MEENKILEEKLLSILNTQKEENTNETNKIIEELNNNRSEIVKDISIERNIQNNWEELTKMKNQILESSKNMSSDRASRAQDAITSIDEQLEELRAEVRKIQRDYVNDHINKVKEAGKQKINEYEKDIELVNNSVKNRDDAKLKIEEVNKVLDNLNSERQQLEQKISASVSAKKAYDDIYNTENGINNEIILKIAKRDELVEKLKRARKQEKKDEYQVQIDALDNDIEKLSNTRIQAIEEIKSHGYDYSKYINRLEIINKEIEVNNKVKENNEDVLEKSNNIISELIDKYDIKKIIENENSKKDEEIVEQETEKEESKEKIIITEEEEKLGREEDDGLTSWHDPAFKDMSKGYKDYMDEKLRLKWEETRKKAEEMYEIEKNKKNNQIDEIKPESLEQTQNIKVEPKVQTQNIKVEPKVQTQNYEQHKNEKTNQTIEEEPKQQPKKDDINLQEEPKQNIVETQPKKINIEIDPDSGVITINDQKMDYKKATSMRNIYKILDEYNLDDGFEDYPERIDNIDYALFMSLYSIDETYANPKESGLVNMYIDIIKYHGDNGDMEIKEYREAEALREKQLKELKERVNINYNFSNKGKGIFRKFKARKNARFAHNELGIAELNGIPKKSLFERIKDRLIGKEEPKKLTSGLDKEKALNITNKLDDLRNREDIVIDNKDNHIENNARNVENETVQETIERLDKSAKEIQEMPDER